MSRTRLVPKDLSAAGLAALAAPTTTLLTPKQRDALFAALTDGEKAFYANYAPAGFSAIEAVRRAGLGEPGSKGRALGTYYRQQPMVARLIADDFAQLRMTADEALARLASIARSADMTLFLRQKDGEDAASLDLETALEDGHGKAIKKYKEKKAQRPGSRAVLVEREVELHDPTAVLQAILRHTPHDGGGEAEAARPNVFTQINVQINNAQP